VEGLELVKQSLGEFDASARRRPVPIEGSQYVLPVDVVIPAIGQSTDVDCAASSGITFRRDTTVEVNKGLATGRAGVYAAGDAVLGPATVVEAVAQGNDVAQAVDAYLQGEQVGSKQAWLAYDEEPLAWNMEEHATDTRVEMPVQDPAVRRRNWKEVELGLAEAACQAECRRCLRCDLDK
jgi:NADPH-dependent glutamate synthase beta subunit-like oxidoreductase